ncbi:hypothetical protein EUGRSUZ_B02009 [Eucalyptus grandis]|uniref:indole-3-pyruvate monooxygenase n=2 Tax=Eucalyptus grandis TaxID=71139 RepID=A0A059D3K6_EUCGR|nr:hypothetical protein EUGRSUZ_B02009 [Eucalyptus grandis]
MSVHSPSTKSTRACIYQSHIPKNTIAVESRRIKSSMAKVAACLNRLGIANIVLEREDCSASLWRNMSYDRLELHLAKQFCELPHMPFPSNSPTFSASYDDLIGKWRIAARNTGLGEHESYVAELLVVASRENSEGVTPEVDGSSTRRRCTRGSNVLVVGCGNSGMEIDYDLWSHGANTSIVARSPVHVFTKEMVFLGMVLLKFLPCRIVDIVMILLSMLKYGDYFKYNLQRPKKGPFYLKATTGRSPTIDVGAMKRIEDGVMKLFPSIKSINGKPVTFMNGTTTVKGYNRGKIPKSYSVGLIKLKSRSVDFNHEIEFDFGSRTFEHVTVPL